jgi:hypothetical protein
MYGLQRRCEEHSLHIRNSRQITLRSGNEELPAFRHWTIPFSLLQWLGVTWYWAVLATVPIMVVAYVLYYRWRDHLG